MRDEELAIDEMDIGFDAAKPAVQRVEQGAFVLIVIMGMRGGNHFISDAKSYSPATTAITAFSFSDSLTPIIIPLLGTDLHHD